MHFTEYNKAWVALIMAVLMIIDQVWGISFGGVTEETVTIILAVLTPILVYLIPNFRST